MNRHDLLVPTLALAVVLPTPAGIAGQKKAIEPDLAGLADSKGLTVFNRAVSRVNDGPKKGAHLSENAGDGVAFVPGIELADGTIELDVRGKDVPQQSFVGVAFHGVDGTTYDAVYFRPFNFKADDPARRSHGVQYVSHPTYTWQKLRADHSGQSAQALNPAPDPNGWFHVRVGVASPKGSVFVGDAK